MKPHAVLFADVGNFIDGIKGSVDGGTSGGIHIYRNITLHIKSIEKNDAILGLIQVVISFHLQLLLTLQT